MRVRSFEMRLIGATLLGCWALAALLVLLSYRPGGPLDLIVGLTMVIPVGVAAAAVAWPPVTRGDRSNAAVVCIGVGALLCLVPSIGGLIGQLVAQGAQTLVPSAEAAYPWFLALLATSLFAGIGLARRIQGGNALRQRRFVQSAAFALGLTLLAASLFASAAVANEIALRDSVAAASRFGPTHAEGEPPACDGPLRAGVSARVTSRLNATVDLRPKGSVELSGTRSGSDFRWIAYIATDAELGQGGVARKGTHAWTRSPGGPWLAAGPDAVADHTIDVRILQTALTAEGRAIFEDRGAEVIEGARARHCRIAVDGDTFAAAFPQVRWLVGGADLHRWRGQLDYWIFLDGELGQVVGSASGEAVGMDPEALLATVEVRMTATSRDSDLVIYPPTS
jgi:hypothetical protein